MNLLDSFDYAMERINRVQQAVSDDRLAQAVNELAEVAVKPGEAQALLDEAPVPRKRRKR